MYMYTCMYIHMWYVYIFYNLHIFKKNNILLYIHVCMNRMYDVLKCDSINKYNANGI